MTERGRGAASRHAERFTIGPSELEWTNGELRIRFDEISLPRPPGQVLPRRIAGTVTVRPAAVSGTVFPIDTDGRHLWWPAGPVADISVDIDRGPGESWKGHGYLDSNWGSEPLEVGFRHWDWARGTTPGGDAIVLYDAQQADGRRTMLALEFDANGSVRHWEAPPARPLPRGFWGVPRSIHADDGSMPEVLATFEDGPFYMRSLVRTWLKGAPVTLMHESFSGTRFASPLIKLMLPVRMPRRC